MKINRRLLGLSLLTMLLTAQLTSGQENPNPLVHTNIVEDNYFDSTQYYDILDAFWDGMGWKSLYPNADGCRVAVSSFFNDFYFLDQNHTATADNQVEQLFNITGIVSTSMADTINECYKFEQQAVLDYYSNNIFVDEADFRTSFLFNLLAQSIIIRSYSYDLLDYSEEGYRDVVEYSRSLGGVISNIIYFTSTTAQGLNYFDLDDDESPYYINEKGGISKEYREPNQQLEKLFQPKIQPRNTTLFQTRRKSQFERNLDQKPQLDHWTKMMPQNIIETEQNFAPRPSEYQKEIIEHFAPKVTQDEIPTSADEVELESPWVLTSQLNMIFGFLDGALNALPQGSSLGDCASDLEDQRTRFLTMYDFIEKDKDLTNAVGEAYIGLKYFNPISVNCYYGFRVFVQPDELENVYSAYSFFENFVFNLGFIYTDLLMLTVGWFNKTKPTTDTNWYYYMAYYLGDFFFRFIFMAETESVGNCWYPWVVCETETTASLSS